MQPLKLSHVSILVLIGKLIIVGLMWTFSSVGFESLQNASHWVIHSFQIKSSLWDLERQFYQYELSRGTGQSAFALTSTPADLERNVLARLESLVTLVRDNPTQFKSSQDLRIAADNFLHDALSDPTRNEVSQARQQASADLRTLFVRMLDEEDRLLQIRFEENTEQFAKGRKIVTALAVLCSLLMIRSFWAIIRYALNAERHRALLRKAEQDALKASEAKSSFIANMSHEIRTPMTAILGYSDLLLARQSSPSERFELIQHIRRNGEHLLRIINDILDLSKIEARKFTIDEQTVELQRLLEEIASMARQRVIEKNLSLDIRYATPLPVKIRTDALRVKQVLINLVGNATKFTEHGGITLMVEVTGNTLAFHVSDTGIGMDAEQIDALFKPFSQGDVTTARKFGGTGLGLAISKTITELLGGKLNVRSQKGIGSTFSLVIPLNAVGEETFQEVQTSDFGQHDEVMPKFDGISGSRGRILLVEDSIDNQIIVVHHLHTMGLAVDVVGNGRAGVNRALESQSMGTPYTAILMDMQLPEMDGYTAVSILREKGYAHPIIAITANVLESDRKRCLSVGCDAFLGKPINLSEFYRTVLSYVAPLAAELNRPETSPNSLHLDPSVDFPSLQGLFVQGLPARRETLALAVKSESAAQIEKITHQLAGAAASYGFGSISAQSFEIKEALRAGATLQSLDSRIQALLAELDKATPQD